jgi:hypothetical protein
MPPGSPSAPKILLLISFEIHYNVCRERNFVMAFHKIEHVTGFPVRISVARSVKRIAVFLSREPVHAEHPSLLRLRSTHLFRLDKYPETYSHLLKKKDTEYIGPLVTYFIGETGRIVYLGGDAVMNLYVHGRKRYKSLNILAVMPGDDLDRCSCMMNNIISSNDGAFSIGFRYRVKKNRQEGCFKEVSQARYIIEPRLEGPEKLLYPFRASIIELDLISPLVFAHAFGVEAK